MKNHSFYFILLVIFTLTIACSNEEDDIFIIENSKNATDCELTILPTTLVAICMNGSDFAFPNETLTYASKFASTNCDYLWTVESGDIEILNVENSIVNSFTKSIATIRFGSDFSGGVISVKAEDTLSEGIIEYTIELEIQ
ncbi:hypothetical protein A9Q86_15785 [Flavobacteriales bacterium 33_180_T64]|nr:hypothetical protein A9Q86_15785 [Flavobacteriales bacterium 33_180_T64]